MCLGINFLSGKVIALLFIVLLITSGISYIIGDFALQVYGLAESKETNVGIYNNYVILGIVTLVFVYVPAFVRVFLIARKRDWAKMTACQRLKQVLNYLLLVLIWPVFSVLM